MGKNSVGNVNRTGRRVASVVVIAKLVRLGYLKPNKRYKPDVILKAVELLRADLWYAGVIEAGDLTKIDKATPPKRTKRRILPSSRPSVLN
jgi:hypothetical protein